eukprot:364050-Chlamydomonas_euryale.AAC.11
MRWTTSVRASSTSSAPSRCDGTVGPTVRVAGLAVGARSGRWPGSGHHVLPCPEQMRRHSLFLGSPLSGHLRGQGCATLAIPCRSGAHL